MMSNLLFVPRTLGSLDPALLVFRLYSALSTKIVKGIFCKSIEGIANIVIPAKAGIQKPLILKNTGFPSSMRPAPIYRGNDE